MQKFIIKITTEDFSLLKDSNLECFWLDPALSENFYKKFTTQAQAKGQLVMGSHSEAVQKFNLDGLIVDLSQSENIAQDYAAATNGLKNKLTGIICRNRRHEAMLAGECSPDFIIFRAWKDGADKIKDLTAWYNDMFVIQSALLPMDQEMDITAFKTDFVIFDDSKYKIFVAKK